MKVQIKLYHFSQLATEVLDFRGEIVVDSSLRFDVNSYIEVLKSLYPLAVFVEFQIGIR